jgi:hypothetical protein
VEESCCPDDSVYPEEVPSPDGVRFLGEPLSADAGDSLGESLAVDEGCSHHEARSPSQKRSAGEVPPDVVLESYAARFQAKEGCAPICSRGAQQGCRLVVELRDSHEPCTAHQRGWPR